MGGILLLTMNLIVKNSNYNKSIIIIKQINYNSVFVLNFPLPEVKIPKFGQIKSNNLKFFIISRQKL